MGAVRGRPAAPKLVWIGLLVAGVYAAVSLTGEKKGEGGVSRSVIQLPWQYAGWIGGGGGEYTRGPLFQGAWGLQAVARLQAWRSSLFHRVAVQYTKLEKEKSEGGTVDIGRVEPHGPTRYDIAMPFLECPYGNLTRVGVDGDVDGGKWLCLEGLFQEQEPDCLIYSLGSAGNFLFESKMLKTVGCEIHTFDCTFHLQGPTINPRRHFYHEVCLGKETRNVTLEDGSVRQYWSYQDMLKNLGHTHRRVSLLKIDIEGFEFDAMSGWAEEEGCKLPLQISMEIHYATIYFSSDKSNFENLYWTQHEMSLGELALWFGHLANLGYGTVSREDNPGGLHCCSEYTFLKVEQPGGCPMISYSPPPGGVPPPRAKNKPQQQNNKKKQQQRS